MSLRHRLAHWLLGWEYVRLQWLGQRRVEHVRHVWYFSDLWWVEAPGWGLDTLAERGVLGTWLHPSLVYTEQPTIHWRPLTPGVAAFYNQPKPDCFQ